MTVPIDAVREAEAGDPDRPRRLVLASASPRRAALLRAAGLEVDVQPVECDETPRPSEVATAYARRIARAKLAAAPAIDTVVLAADTTVWHAHPPVPIGKPDDRTGAAAMLRQLTDGPPHRVSTAFALRWPDGTTRCELVTTVVWMRPLSHAELRWYLDGDEWRDKAGGYGIQGHAAGFVTRVEGSYTNVVGLPVAEVIAALEEGPR